MKQPAIPLLLLGAILFFPGISSISYANEEYNETLDAFFQQITTEDDDQFYNTDTGYEGQFPGDETDQYQNVEQKYVDEEAYEVDYLDDNEYEPDSYEE